MGSFIRQVVFSGGEVGPPWWGRSDLERYKTSVRQLRNWLVSKSGSLLNRPGTRWVGPALSNAVGEKSWLEQFNFSGDQTYVLEFGEKKLSIRDAQAVPVSLFIAGSTIIVDGTNIVRYSLDDGSTWNSVTLPAGGAARALAFNGTRTVAVGTDYCATTDDAGVTWTQRAIGVITANSIVWTGTNFIVVGSAGKYVVSADGITWAVVGTTAVAANWTGVAFGNGQAVATGYYAAGTAIYAACASNPNAAPAGVVFETTTSVAAAITNGGASAAVWTGQRWVFVFRRVLIVGNFATVEEYSAVAATGTGAWTVLSLMGAYVPITSAAGGGNLLAAWNGVVGYAATPHVGAGSIEYTFTALGAFTQVSTNLLMKWLWVANAAAMYVDVNRNVYQRRSTWGSAYWVLLYQAPVLLQGLAESEYTAATVLVSPYASVDLPRLRMVQSGDTIYIFLHGYATQKLVRSVVGAGVAFAFSLAAPTPPEVAVTAPVRVGVPPIADDSHPNVEWSWSIVWVSEDGTESLLGEVLTELASQCYPDRPVVLNWSGVAGAVEYFIFRGRGGQWGYVGFKKAENGTGTEAFTDEGGVPDISVVPRTYDDVLGTDAPSVGAFYQDRLMVANSSLKPNLVRGSASSDYLNFDKVKFQREDSPISFAANSRRFEEVRALIPLKTLLILTSESEASLSGGQVPLSFASVDYKTHSKRGSSWVEPTVVGNTTIYVQRDNQVVRDIIANSNATITEDYTTNELTMFVDHLLVGSGRRVIDMAYCQHPYSTIWFVLSDGEVLTLSYIPELKQAAWSHHDFGGVVESVTSVYDGTEDVPWFTVVRDVGRQIERLSTRQVTTLANGCFFDDARQFTAPDPLAVHYSEGTLVGVVQDGVYKGQQLVTGGTITPSGEWSSLWVGRIITCDFESLDVPDAKERKKTIVRTYVHLTDTPALAASAGVLQAGEDLDNLSPASFSSLEEGTIEVNVETVLNPGGRVALRLATPTPVEILSISREVVVGQ